MEGCECSEGFVLEGIACVPTDTCGCFVEGFYQEVRGYDQDRDVKIRYL